MDTAPGDVAAMTAPTLTHVAAPPPVATAADEAAAAAAAAAAASTASAAAAARGRRRWPRRARAEVADVGRRRRPSWRRPAQRQQQQQQQQQQQRQQQRHQDLPRRSGARRGRAAVQTRGVLISDASFDRATAVYVFVSVVATAVVLVREWDAPCDTPLRGWLVGNAVCGLLYVAFKYLAEMQRRSPRLYAACAWTYGVLSCLSVAWFCVGFIFVLSSKTCRRTAPETFCLSVIFSFFELFVLATCFLLLACICFVDTVAPATIQAYMGVGNPRGATSDDLRRLRAVKYTAALFPDVGDRTCSICLCDYEEGDTIHILPCPGNARHAFHVGCVEQWLSREKTCPVCKHDVTAREAPETAAPEPASVEQAHATSQVIALVQAPRPDIRPDSRATLHPARDGPQNARDAACD